ncbi:MAG: hypothetical protein JW904_00715 [Spirochaetales bacterium]|nr:hypothetical protein [Spirochaetales bacterium]
MKRIFVILIMIFLLAISGYTENVMYQAKDATFYISASGGVSLPFGELSTIMETGYTVRTYGAYLFQFDLFDLGLGGMTGFDYFSTRESVPSPYFIIAIPVAAHAQISSKFGLPFRLFAEVNAGASINTLFFQNDSTVLNSFRIFLQVAFGVGNDVSDLFNIAQFVGLTVIFFEDPVYVMLNPGLRIEVKF